MRRFLLIYGALLAASWITWAARPAPPLPANLQIFDARVVAAPAGGDPAPADASAAAARTTPLAYRLRGAPLTAAPPLLLLHGSPGSGADFDDLPLDELSGARAILEPDLPGFGASRGSGPLRALPDYSARAHAAYALQLLDALGVARAHVAGFSLGGGVALELTRLAPQRVASLTLIASVGVQEMELFGSYEMNHLVHLLQLGALRAAEWGLPHFGAWDRPFFGAEYARNFADTDQRPWRAALLAWDGPALILHGGRDLLVPAAAAHESARLLPQAEFVLLPEASHFLPWTESQRLARELTDFTARADADAVRSRAQAPAERQAAALAPFDPADVPPFAGVALLVAMLLLAAATLVSEDLTCIGAGVLVAQGRIGLVAASGACFAGIFIGDVLLYFAGRALGPAALRRAPLRWVVSEGGVARAREEFHRRGLALIFLTRFMPGLRLPTYFVAGVLRTGALRFALYFSIAGLIWTPALVWGSSLIGREAGAVVKEFGRWAPWAAAGLILVLFLIVRLGVPALTWRGRRLLLGAWRRKRRWEYWPRWAFYPPVVLLGVLRGALRHRSLTVVTAANPAIPTGGIVGESKAAILAALGPHPEIARSVALPPAAAAAATPAADPDVRLAPALAANLGWPLVLKPDLGERGRDVVFARDAAEARAALAARPWALVAQEYVGGLEFGVFWERAPGAPRGRVTSLTRKELPDVIGDGRSTLERLILSHPRHVNMGKHFLEVNAARLHEVPAVGERVVLSPLGTHARGATFRDARDLITPTLEEAIERISRRIAGPAPGSTPGAAALAPGAATAAAAAAASAAASATSGPPTAELDGGFFLGRYDLRVPSEADLRAGRNLKILELNGLTAEPTHVYDPAAPLLPAWRALIGQWRRAYDVGAANAAAGARPATLREVLRAWRRARTDGPRD